MKLFVPLTPKERIDKFEKKLQDLAIKYQIVVMSYVGAAIDYESKKEKGDMIEFKSAVFGISLVKVDEKKEELLKSITQAISDEQKKDLIDKFTKLLYRT